MNKTAIHMANSEDKDRFQEICTLNQTVTDTMNVEGIMEEQALVHVHEMGLENFLLPLPKAIALQGQLMLFATMRDFTLSEVKPNQGYKHLVHPESFHACLLQVVFIFFLVANKQMHNTTHMFFSFLCRNC